MQFTNGGRRRVGVGEGVAEAKGEGGEGGREGGEGVRVLLS